MTSSEKVLGPHTCKCGYEVPFSMKSWEMRKEAETVLRAYLYNCPKCGEKFRIILRETRSEVPCEGE